MTPPGTPILNAERPGKRGSAKKVSTCDTRHATVLSFSNYSSIVLPIKRRKLLGSEYAVLGTEYWVLGTEH